jgi:putative peptidoglycan lipid II flippase
MSQKQAAQPAPANPARGTARSSAIMAAGTMASRVLGLVRNVLLAVAIGIDGLVSDVFASANTLPNLIYLLVAGGVFNAVLVPQIIKASRAPDRGADYISRLLSLAMIVLGILTVLITLAAPWILRLLTSFNDEQIELATIFAYWCFPQIFFYGVYALIGQILNANESFGPYMWAPVVNNIVAILGLVAFIGLFGREVASPHTLDNWTAGNTLVLAGGTTLGIIIQALVLLWPLRKLGLGLSLKFGWRGVGLGQAGRVAGWTIATMVIGQGAYLVYGKIATIATEARPEYLAMEPPQNIAGQATFDTAQLVYLLPHSVIALSLATVLFNRMSHAFTQKDLAGVRSTLSFGLRTTGVATVFAAAALIVLAGPLGMIFSGGDASAGAILGQVIVILAASAPFLSANFLMNRVFYASENARTPLAIQSVLSAFGIILALGASLLPPHLVIFGLAVAFALGNMAAVLVSHHYLQRKIGHYDAGGIVDVHVRLGFAAAGSAAAGALVLWLLGGYSAAGFAWHSVWTAAVVIAVVGAVMALAYLLLLRVFHVQELKDFLAPVMARLRRA